MPLTKLIEDVENISKLADEPNDVDGLTAAELKAEFDKAGETIKVYLNDTLVMELDAQFAAQAQENAKLEKAIADLVAVSIPDGSVTGAKLADKAVSHRVLGLNAVESSNIKDGAVGEKELATNAVTVDKILAKAVTDVKLADRAVSQRALGIDAVWDGNIKAGEVKTRAIADNAVTGVKIADGAVSKEYTFTLPASGWTASGDLYKQTVSVNGITADSKGVIELDLSNTPDEKLEDFNSAWGAVLKASPAAGSVVFKASEIPTENLPVHILEVQK